jgi:hypothetical protein
MERGGSRHVDGLLAAGAVNRLRERKGDCVGRGIFKPGQTLKPFGRKCAVLHSERSQAEEEAYNQKRSITDGPIKRRGRAAWVANDVDQIAVRLLQETFQNESEFQEKETRTHSRRSRRSVNHEDSARGLSERGTDRCETERAGRRARCKNKRSMQGTSANRETDRSSR